MNTCWPALVPGAFYHVYNRGNNRENIFYSAENVRFFLERYTKYMEPVLEMYAYCLLPNHFHLLARVKTKEEIEAGRWFLDLPSLQDLVSLKKLPGNEDTSAPGFLDLPLDLPSLQDLVSLTGKEKTFSIPEETGILVSHQFRLMFMSYAKAINKQEGRVGSLFQKGFRRKPVASEQHLINMVLYIHANPQLHGLCGDFRGWTDSSYYSMLSESPTRLQRRAVLDWFGGKEAFVERHRGYIDWKTAGEGWIEEE